MQSEVNPVSEKPAPRDATERFLLGLLLLSIVAGVSVRVYHYIANRSLFLDEASITLNLIRRSWLGLLAPLDHYQAAPIGFLLSEKAIMHFLGSGEQALRLLPLFASVAGLLVYPAMVARYLGARGKLGTLRTLRAADLGIVVLATALLAVANFPIYYSVEVKQYALDLLFCILLLHAGAPLLGPSPKRNDLRVFTLVATIAVTFSHPATFIVASVVIVAALGRLQRGAVSQALIVACTALPAALLFAYLYSLSVPTTTDRDVLTNFWSFGFMPLPPWRDWSWFGRAVGSFLANPAEMAWPGAWLLLLAGLFSWLRRRWTLALVTLLTLVFVLVASALKSYPFAVRLMLFTMPIVYFMASEGVRRIAGWLQYQAYASIVWIVLGAMLLQGVGEFTVRRALDPYAWREHFSPAMTFMSAQVRANDIVYCYIEACPQLEYYAHRMGFPPVDVREGTYFGGFPETSLDEFDQLRGNGRVWVVMSRAYPGDADAVSTKVDSMGRRVSEFTAYGVSVGLYDLTP